MLERKDIQVLNRVGPATVLGVFLREYWQPILTPGELKPRARPVRVRLLGESLVAFRDDRGQVGLVGEACSHAGASLSFADNEGDGIRCVLHDWKFDAQGNCVDLPGLVPGSGLLARSRIKGYRCAERGGLVLAYLGKDQDAPPPLPELPWAPLAESPRRQRRFLIDRSWARTLAGVLDPTHASEPHPALESVQASFRFPLMVDRAGGPSGDDRLWLVPVDDDHTQVWQLHWDRPGSRPETFEMPSLGAEDPDPFAFPEGSSSPLLDAYRSIVDTARALREGTPLPSALR